MTRQKYTWIVIVWKFFECNPTNVQLSCESEYKNSNAIYAIQNALKNIEYQLYKKKQKK